MLETELTARLRRHVERLAGEFGERHVFRPQALHAAKDYLREVWTGQGWQVRAQEYPVSNVRSANLEVTLGLPRPDGCYCPTAQSAR
jgi:hypothetical protein